MTAEYISWTYYNFFIIQLVALPYEVPRGVNIEMRSNIDSELMNLS